MLNHLLDEHILDTQSYLMSERRKFYDIEKLFEGMAFQVEITTYD